MLNVRQPHFTKKPQPFVGRSLHIPGVHYMLFVIYRTFVIRYGISLFIFLIRYSYAVFRYSYLVFVIRHL